MPSLLVARKSPSRAETTRSAAERSLRKRGTSAADRAEQIKTLPELALRLNTFDGA